MSNTYTVPSCLSWRSVGVFRDWLNHSPTSPSVVDPSSLEICSVCKQPGVKVYYLRFLDCGPEGLAGNVGQARALPEIVPLASILPFSIWCLHQAYSSRGELVVSLRCLMMPGGFSFWVSNLYFSFLPPRPTFSSPLSLLFTWHQGLSKWFLSPGCLLEALHSPGLVGIRSCSVFLLSWHCLTQG